MVDSWRLIGTEPVFDGGLFHVCRDRVRSPRTGEARDVHVIHMPDWLLVVPVTCDGLFVMVRQYRHGARSAGLEFPGGLRDQLGETAAQGSARELAEETGYGGGQWQLLGELMPQPALLATRAHFFLARDVRALAPPRPDPGEDITVELIAPTALAGLLARGEIHNAMSVAALALLRRAGLPDLLQSQQEA